MFSPARWAQIVAVAKLLGATDHQIKKWRELRRIPALWHLKLLDACKRRRVPLSAKELLKQQRNEEKA